MDHVAEKEVEQYRLILWISNIAANLQFNRKIKLKTNFFHIIRVTKGLEKQDDRDAS